jgi:GntR family phosphonate transport system transcriptional regulator
MFVFEGNGPLYRQISATLLDEIQANYEPGDYLPPEQLLAERFGVNRHTVRRAIDELVKDGALERYRGRGTIILDARIDYPIRKNSRFTDTLAAQGHGPTSRVLYKDLIPATGGVARRLEVSDGTEVVWVETLRSVDGRALGISAHFLPQPYADTVWSGYETGSLHQFLEQEHGLLLRRAYSLITAVLPEEEDARRLQMSRRQPVLRMKTVNVSLDTAVPVEYAVSRTRADAVQVRVDLDD